MHHFALLCSFHFLNNKTFMFSFPPAVYQLCVTLFASMVVRVISQILASVQMDSLGNTVRMVIILSLYVKRANGKLDINRALSKHETSFKGKDAIFFPRILAMFQVCPPNYQLTKIYQSYYVKWLYLLDILKLIPWHLSVQLCRPKV